MIQPNARGAWAELDGQLRPFVARRLDSSSDVDDVLQDIYLRIQTGLNALRDSDRFGPWVYQVARSALADHRRARSRHRLPLTATPAEEAELTSAVDQNDDAEQGLAKYLALFVAALPSPYREAVTLTELEGMTQKDAADLLGISVSGMKSRVRRGRQQMRELLHECCEIALDARGHVLSYDRRPDGKVPKNCCGALKNCAC